MGYRYAHPYYRYAGLYNYRYAHPYRYRYKGYRYGRPYAGLYNYRYARPYVYGYTPAYNYQYARPYGYGPAPVYYDVTARRRAFMLPRQFALPAANSKVGARGYDCLGDRQCARVRRASRLPDRYD